MGVTGWEIHGISNTTPTFEQEGDYVFYLAPGEPGEDAGENIPNFSNGFTGNAPDMGAFERGVFPPDTNCPNNDCDGESLGADDGYDGEIDGSDDDHDGGLDGADDHNGGLDGDGPDHADPTAVAGSCGCRGSGKGVSFLLMCLLLGLWCIRRRGFPQY